MPEPRTPNRTFRFPDRLYARAKRAAKKITLRGGRKHGERANVSQYVRDAVARQIEQDLKDQK